MSTEKRAIGILNGWRCPVCKRLVKGPKNPVGPILGGCGMCGTTLIFERAPVSVFKTEPHRLTEGLERRQKLELEQAGKEEPLTLQEILEKYVASGENEGRWVPVNFIHNPKFLRALEQVAKDRKLLLSEVVIGFAARGYKDWLKSIGGVVKK